MHHSDVVDFEFSSYFYPDFLHLADSHRFVGFVLEVKRFAPVGIVPHNAFEHYHSAIFAGLLLPHQIGGGNSRASQQIIILVRAAADRRKKRHFISIL